MCVLPELKPWPVRTTGADSSPVRTKKTLPGGHIRTCRSKSERWSKKGLRNGFFKTLPALNSNLRTVNAECCVIANLIRDMPPVVGFVVPDSDRLIWELIFRPIGDSGEIVFWSSVEACASGRNTSESWGQRRVDSEYHDRRVPNYPDNAGALNNAIRATVNETYCRYLKGGTGWKVADFRAASWRLPVRPSEFG